MGFLEKIFRLGEKKSDIINDYFASQSTANFSQIGDIYRGSNVDPVKQLGFITEILYYLTAKPVAKSIDLISQEFSSLKLVLKNKENGEIERSHDVLSLLNNPNKDATQSEFLFGLAAFYLITGNSFVQAIGNIIAPPSQLRILLPQLFSFDSNGKSVVPEVFRYQTGFQSIDYFLNNEVKFEKNRYIDKFKQSELWHVKRFNPLLDNGNPWGISQINAIQLEIQQYLSSGKHNLSLIDNGARLGGLLMVEGNMTTVQRDSLKEQFDELYTGSRNAGRTMLTESGGGKLDYKSLAENAKDMDFFNLKKDAKLDIYDEFNVPLPLVSPDHMTMDNYSEARLALYDNAVLPMADRLLLELQNLLFPRYKNLESFELTYDKRSIGALEPRFNAEMKMKIESNALTINEKRNLLGHEDIENGDEIFQPLNLVPLSNSSIVNPNLEKSRFIQILRKNGFKENEIAAKVKENYGDNG